MHLAIGVFTVGVHNGFTGESAVFFEWIVRPISVSKDGQWLLLAVAEEEPDGRLVSGFREHDVPLVAAPIDYTGEDVADVLSRHRKGRGVDLVLDGVGGDVFHESLNALAPFGRLVTYEFASGHIAEVDTGRLLFENHWVFGFHLRYGVETDLNLIHEAVPELSEALAAG